VANVAGASRAIVSGRNEREEVEVIASIFGRCRRGVAPVILGILCASCGGGGGGSDAPPTPAGDTTAPSVSATSPEAGSTGLAGTLSITATFSEALDCGSVPAGAIAVVEGSVPIPGTTSCSGSVLTFTPSGALPTRATLEARVNPSVKDLAGNALNAAHAWSFGTRPWTLQFGTPASDSAVAVATDSAGNVFISGSTSGQFDGHAGSGESDVMLVKFDRFGVRQWSRLFGTTRHDGGQAVATDGEGNVFIAGWSGDIGSDPENPKSDAFIAKYGGDGALLWRRELKSSDDETVRGLAVDPAGNVVAVGFTRGSLFSPSAGHLDAFVLKMDRDGTTLWSHQVGSDTLDNAGAAAIDAGGNVYVTGYTAGALDGHDNAGEVDAFLLKYDSDGVLQWSKLIGTTASEASSAVALDHDGRVYLGVRTTGVLAGSANAGGVDTAILKFDGSGNLLWARQAGSTMDDLGLGIAVDASGTVVAGGYTAGALDGHASFGGWDAFLVKYDGNGVKLWSRQVGTTADDLAWSLQTFEDAIHVVGTTDGTFDGLPPIGDADIFVLKFDLEGRQR
jgi:hypothetical protein